jgi:hypothetical protein
MTDLRRSTIAHINAKFIQHPSLETSLTLTNMIKKMTDLVNTQQEWMEKQLE